MTDLTFNPVESGGDFTCPPKETYVLELIAIGEFEDKPAFGSETMINTQSRFSFQVVEYDYDPDYDEQDWNGVEVRDWYVFFKHDTVKDKTYNTWCHEKSKTYPMLTALLGHEPVPGEKLELSDLVGKRVKATVEPKESGYPKISNPIKYRQRRKGAAEASDTEAEADSPFHRKSKVA